MKYHDIPLEFLCPNVSFVVKKFPNIYLGIGKEVMKLHKADILSGKNARAWVSMVLYLKK